MAINDLIDAAVGLVLLIPLAVHTIRFRKVIILVVVFVSLPLLLSTLIVVLAPILPVVWWAMAVAKTARAKKFAFGEALGRRALLGGYLVSLATLVMLIGTSSEAFLLPFVFTAKGDPMLYAPPLMLSLAAYGFACVGMVGFAWGISRHGRSYIEDLSRTMVLSKSGENLSLPMALARYLLMLATFPLGFGLINFVFPEPLYNKWTGAVEYRNEAQCIKYGWLYRSVKRLFAGKEAGDRGR